MSNVHSLFYTRAKLQASVCSMSVHYSGDKLQASACSMSVRSLFYTRARFTGLWVFLIFFIGGSCTFRGFLPQAFCVVFAITDSFPFSSFARHGFETVTC